MGKTDERARQILEMVAAHGRLHVRTVSEQLEISESTVRRTFADLEEKGLLVRVHGGVQLPIHSSHIYSFNHAYQKRVEQKLSIARAALDLIVDGSRVFLDSGTTLMRFAELLALRLREGRTRDITILTNSMTHGELLAPLCKLILVGGEVRLPRRDVCGAIAERMLRRYRVDRSFLGADAIDVDNGFMTTDEQTASMNEIVIERSEQTVVLADSDKFRRNSFVTYAALSSVDSIVTDWELSADDAAVFEGAGARITTVPQTSHLDAEP